MQLTPALALPALALLRPPPLGLALEHKQLPQLDDLIGRQPGLDDLARLLQTAGHSVDDDRAALLLALVDVLVLVVRRDGVAQHVRVQFDHVWFVAADAGDVAPLFAAFRVGEVAGWEERGLRGRGAEDDVAGADVVFEEAAVFGVHGGQDGFLGFAVVLLADGVYVVWVVGLGIV